MFTRALRTVTTGAAVLLLPLVLPLSPALSAQSLREQTQAVQSPRDVGVGPSHVLSINPFMPLLGWFQGEYEQRVQNNLSFALAGSYLEFDNDHYTNIDAKLRLYPDDRGLRGLGLAAGLGIGRIQRDVNYCESYTLEGEPLGCRRTESAPSFSVEGQYQWLLGTNRATAVTMGGGVKRYFVSDANDGGINRIMPTLRLTVGYAFR